MSVLSENRNNPVVNQGCLQSVLTRDECPASEPRSSLQKTERGLGRQGNMINSSMLNNSTLRKQDTTRISIEKPLS